MRAACLHQPRLPGCPTGGNSDLRRHESRGPKPGSESSAPTASQVERRPGCATRPNRRRIAAERRANRRTRGHRRSICSSTTGRFRDLKKDDSDSSSGRQQPTRPAVYRYFAKARRGNPLPGMVRHLQQRQPHVGSAEPARFRDAGPVPDECQRLEQSDGHAGGQPAGRPSRVFLRRRTGPDGEVPPLRSAFQRVAGVGQKTVATKGPERSSCKIVLPRMALELL